ncbi:MAG: DUF2802 domain-containing protein [Gammaproteobacteria bacterium]|nr:DUF2802 domain-containing protein [Gammaproteobacteria bacterium]
MSDWLLYLLLFLLLPLVFLLVIAWIWGGKRQRQLLLEQQLQQRQLASLQSELSALCSSSVTLGERLSRSEQRVVRLEQLLRQLDTGQRQLRHRQADMGGALPEDAVFEQALKLAERGVSREELMELCNISPGEADLVLMMRRSGQG